MRIKDAKIGTINEAIHNNKLYKKSWSLINTGCDTKLLVDITTLCNIEDINKMIIDLQTVKSIIESNTDLVL